MLFDSHIEKNTCPIQQIRDSTTNLTNLIMTQHQRLYIRLLKTIQSRIKTETQKYHHNT